MPFAGTLSRSTAIGLGIFTQRRTFQGGVYLPARRELTAHRPIERLTPPERLWVPMAQGDEPPAEAAVRVGDAVTRGQLVGRPVAEGAVAVHAPFAGRIVGIGRIDTARREEVPALIIEVTCGPDPVEGLAPAPSPVAPDPLSVPAMAERADRCGVATAAGPIVSLGAVLRLATERGVSDVIINAMPSEPMLTAAYRILLESAPVILEVAQWVRTALGAERVWLAVEREDRTVWPHCRDLARLTPVRAVALPGRYPQADPVLLTQSVVGREVPYGRSPLDVGVLVLDPVGLSALARDEPMLDVPVTVTGAPVDRPGNYRIAPGTSFAEVLRQVGLRQPAAVVVEGGPMTGRSVPSLDVVVTKRTTGILVIGRDAYRVPRPEPCIRCGWCHETCPTGLDPPGMLDLVERERYEGAGSLYPHACIDCGVCSYVCPSDLPLMQAAARLKEIVPRPAGEGA